MNSCHENTAKSSSLFLCGTQARVLDDNLHTNIPVSDIHNHYIFHKKGSFCDPPPTPTHSGSSFFSVDSVK